MVISRYGGRGLSQVRPERRSAGPHFGLAQVGALLGFVLLASACAARVTQRTTQAAKAPVAAPTTCVGKVPSTEVDLASLAHKTQFDSTCYVALANVPFVVVFVNNTTALSGNP